MTMTMKVKGIFGYAGWSAYVTFAAMLFAGVLVPALAPVGVLDTLEGIGTLVLVLSMLPIAPALHQIYHASSPGLSTLALIIGVAAILVAAAAKVLLLFGAAEPAGPIAVLDDITFGVIGVWLLFNSYLTYSTGALPREFVWSSLAAGTGMVIVAAGLLTSDPLPLWASAAGTVMVIAYLIWAIWLGRLLLSGKLTGVRQSTSIRGETA